MEKDIIIASEGFTIYSVELKYISLPYSVGKREDIRILRMYKEGTIIASIRLDEYRLEYIEGNTISKTYRVVRINK